jgi:trimeric autotransporter adhesin
MRLRFPLSPALKFRLPTLTVFGVRVFVPSMAAAMTLLVGCSSGPRSDNPSAASKPNAVSIAVTGTTSLIVGQNQQLSATLKYSDGTTKDMTTSAIWTSSATVIATVSAGGAVTGLSVGQSTITATTSGVSGTATVTVAPMLKSIAVTGNTSLMVGQSQQLTASATYSDGSTKDVTGTATWTSSAIAVAIVSAGGSVTALSVGQSTITATAEGMSVTTTIMVSPALKSIAVGGTTSVVVGKSQQLTATATYSDGTMKDVTGTAVWNSSAQGVAAVSSSGVVAAVSAGQSTITASLTGISGTLVITVIERSLSSLSVSPSEFTIFSGTSQQFGATGVYNDGSFADLTSQVTWSSSNTATASVNSSGVVLGNAAGTATINASSGSVSTESTVTVSSASTGFIYINDLTDSRLFQYQAGGGAQISLWGTRDSTGNPTGITGFRTTSSNGSYQDFAVDSLGKPTQIGPSDGSYFGLNWTSTSTATMTGIASDRSGAQSIDLSTSSSGTNLTPKLRQGVSHLSPTTLSSELRRPIARAVPPIILPPASPTLATIRVTSCNGKTPEDTATVSVTKVAAFGGDPIRAFSTGPGTGTYVADFGSGPYATTAASVSAVQSVLAPVCNFLSQGQPIPNQALELSTTGCLVFAEVPILAGSCVAAGVGLELLNKACTANSGLSGLSSFADYVDSNQTTISLQYAASLNGNTLQQTQLAPSKGPTPSDVVFDFPCPVIDHVNVDPSAASVPAASTQILTAVPFDTQSKVLQSSGFQWQWASATPTVATVTGDPTTIGVVAGLTTGTSVVTATETTNNKSADSDITVSQQYTYIISDSADGTASWNVDDNLDVYLSGNLIYTTGNARSALYPPFTIQASPGDTLRFVTRDTYGISSGLWALYLTCSGSSNSVLADPGFITDPSSGGVTQDLTFSIPTIVGCGHP